MLTAGGHLLVFITVEPDRLHELSRAGEHRRGLKPAEAAELYERRKAAAIAAGALILRGTGDVDGSVERIVAALDGNA